MLIEIKVEIVMSWTRARAAPTNTSLVESPLSLSLQTLFALLARASPSLLATVSRSLYTPIYRFDWFFCCLSPSFLPVRQEEKNTSYRKGALCGSFGVVSSIMFSFRGVDWTWISGHCGSLVRKMTTSRWNKRKEKEEALYTQTHNV